MDNNPNLSFDQARLAFTKSKMLSNNIDENGLPKDPKLVTFSK